MKYIIDIPDTGYVSEETGQLYLPLRSAECDESRNPTWIITGYHCEPYTEPDRKTIEDEVWAFAKKVRLEEFIDEEGRLHGYISGFNSYSEAKAKYKAWLKEKDEIRVGDELINHIGKTYVIYDIDDHTAYGINLDKYPCTQECFPVRDGYSPKRTGRTFPEIAELVKKMGKLDD